jgi:hypothetical protein
MTPRPGHDKLLDDAVYGRDRSPDGEAAKDRAALRGGK